MLPGGELQTPFERIRHLRPLLATTRAGSKLVLLELPHLKKYKKRVVRKVQFPSNQGFANNHLKKYKTRGFPQANRVLGNNHKTRKSYGTSPRLVKRRRGALRHVKSTLQL
jgi:hypothetical protein